MAELVPISRRHTLRHEPRPYEHQASSGEDHDRLDSLAPSVTVGVADAPKSNPRKRRGPSTLVAAAAPASARKMSSPQLRLFFLLCVAVYFATICFADDIVKFAQWMSDDDPVDKWNHAAVATARTPSTVRTPTTTEPPATVRTPATLGKATIAGKGDTDTRTTEKKTNDEKANHEETRFKDEKTGNLRGDGATVETEAATKMTEATAGPAPSLEVKDDAETEKPTTAPITVLESPAEKPHVEVTKAAADDSVVMTPETRSPLEGVVDKKVVKDETKESAAVVDVVDEEQRREPQDNTDGMTKEAVLPVETTSKVPEEDEEDAPLDSVEDRETRADKSAEPTALEATPEPVEAPAEIPKLIEPVQEAAPEPQVAHQTDEQEAETVEVQERGNDDGARNLDSAT